MKYEKARKNLLIKNMYEYEGKIKNKPKVTLVGGRSAYVNYEYEK